MDKVRIIAVREFLETVRTKAFFLSVFIVPGLIMMFMFGADKVEELTERETKPPRRVALLDETGQVAEPFAAQLEEFNREHPQRPFTLERCPADSAVDALAQRVRDGELYAYLHVPMDVLDGDGACLLARLDQQLQARRELEQMLNRAVQAARFRRAGIDQEDVQRLQRPVKVAPLDVRTGKIVQDDTVARVLAPFAFMFLLFMGTMQISHGLLTSLLEEKSSRIIEVLLSAVSPVQLMAGKILGAVMVGMLLLSVWAGVGYYGAHSRGYGAVVSAQLLLYAGLYFLPGFLLLSAILGAVGSACNTLKEAQSMASPVTILTIVPMVLWWPISQNPDSTLSLLLSYVPPITPFIMILRVCADPDLPLWQVLTTQALLWLSVGVVIWAAGKIFRVGILMYGKPPTPRELLHWIKYA